MRRDAAAQGLAGALILLAFASPASARCGDAPGPKVDWTGCSKPQLMLGNDDLTGGVFSKAVLNFTDFAGAKLQGEAVSRLIRNGGTPEMTLEDSIANMRVLDAVFRSERSGAWENVALDRGAAPG